MTDMLMQFFLALIATLCYSIIFRVPRRDIPACVIIGALGWITYIVTVYYLESPVIGCFAGACLVGLLSPICARFMKEAATIFIIPGILCLVPGSNIFKTMEYLLLHKYEDSASIGVQTLLMAGAIALGILVMGVAVGIIRNLLRKGRAFRMERLKAKGRQQEE